jgi:hypothetical protein
VAWLFRSKQLNLKKKIFWRYSFLFKLQWKYIEKWKNNKPNKEKLGKTLSLFANSNVKLFSFTNVFVSMFHWKHQINFRCCFLVIIKLKQWNWIGSSFCWANAWKEITNGSNFDKQATKNLCLARANKAEYYDYFSLLIECLHYLPIAKMVSFYLA